jgi:hypothetical protein
MANVDAPFGLKPVRHLNGMSWNGHTEKMYVSANDATALFVGDAIVGDATTANRETTGLYPTIKAATVGNGNYILGVVISFDPDPDDLTSKHRAASTERYVNVCMDPDVIFYIADDGAAAPTKNTPGANAVLIGTHAGSTATGLSGMELDMNSDAPAEDASNQLLILKRANIESNILGARAIWEVLINLHSLRATGDGDGALGVLGA